MPTLSQTDFPAAVLREFARRELLAELDQVELDRYRREAAETETDDRTRAAHAARLGELRAAKHAAKVASNPDRWEVQRVPTWRMSGRVHDPRVVTRLGVYP